MNHRTLFVLAPQADPTTGAALTIELAMRIHGEIQDKGYWVLPEPTWTQTDYSNQCIYDPKNTAGALIVMAVENDTGQWNYILLAQGYTNLDAVIEVVGCNKIERIPTVGSYSKQTMATQSTSIAKSLTETSLAKKTEIDTKVPSPPSAKATPAIMKTKTWTGPMTQTVTTATPSSPPAITDTTTEQAMALPEPAPTPLMPVVSTDVVSGSAKYGSVPLYFLAGVAAYVASKQNSVTTTTNANVPAGATGNSGTGSTSYSVSTNTSSVPGAWALIAGSFTSLANISIPGINPSRVLKRAAASLASDVLTRLQDSTRCDDTCHKVIFQGGLQTESPTGAGR